MTEAGLCIRSIHIKYLEEYIKYLSFRPRWFMGTNNKKMGAMAIQASRAMMEFQNFKQYQQWRRDNKIECVPTLQEGDKVESNLDDYDEEQPPKGDEGGWGTSGWVNTSFDGDESHTPNRPHKRELDTSFGEIVTHNKKKLRFSDDTVTTPTLTKQDTVVIEDDFTERTPPPSTSTNDGSFGMKSSMREIMDERTDRQRERKFKDMTLAQKIALATGYFEKYNVCDFLQCQERAKVAQDCDAVEFLELLFCAQNTGFLLKQAKKKYTCKQEQAKFFQKFMEETTTDLILKQDKRFLTYEQTQELYFSWCKEQGINAPVLIMKLYLIISESVPKVNTMAMIGPPNAGKSFWIDTLLYQESYVAKVVNADRFSFANLANCKVGYLNEIILNDSQMETFKEISEGKTTTVDRKFDADGVTLTRVPIFVTANKWPWINPEHHKQMLTRMFFEHPRMASACLSEHAQKNPNCHANPEFFKDAFNTCIKFFNECPESDPIKCTKEGEDDCELWKDYFFDN